VLRRRPPYTTLIGLYFGHGSRRMIAHDLCIGLNRTFLYAKFCVAVDRQNVPKFRYAGTGVGLDQIAFQH
jgi:hypothetical protein